MIELDEKGLPKAAGCQLALYHSPKVTRFVNHHIQPQVCGGLTQPPNIAQVCDNCHYTVHACMFELRLMIGPRPATAVDQKNLSRGSRKQRALAARGYNLCVAAGTWQQIPSEG